MSVDSSPQHTAGADCRTIGDKLFMGKQFKVCKRKLFPVWRCLHPGWDDSASPISSDNSWSASRCVIAFNYTTGSTHSACFSSSELLRNLFDVFPRRAKRRKKAKIISASWPRKPQKTLRSSFRWRQKTVSRSTALSGCGAKKRNLLMRNLFSVFGSKSS